MFLTAPQAGCRSTTRRPGPTMSCCGPVGVLYTKREMRLGARAPRHGSRHKSWTQAVRRATPGGPRNRLRTRGSLVRLEVSELQPHRFFRVWRPHPAGVVPTLLRAADWRRPDATRVKAPPRANGGRDCAYARGDPCIRASYSWTYLHRTRSGAAHRWTARGADFDEGRAAD